MRKILKIVTILFVIIAILLTSGYIYLIVKGKDFIVARLEKQLGKKVSFSSVSVSYPLTIKIDQLKVEGYGTAKQIFFSLSLPHLLFKQVHFTRIEIIEPNFIINRKKGEKVSWVPFSTASQEQQAPAASQGPEVTAASQASEIPAPLQNAEVPAVTQNAEVFAPPQTLEPVIASKSSETPTASQSPETPAVTQNAEVSATPQNAEVPAVVQNAEVPAAPQAPETIAAPEVPEPVVAPKASDVSVSPQSPQAVAVPQNPQVSVIPVQEKKEEISVFDFFAREIIIQKGYVQVSETSENETQIIFSLKNVSAKIHNAEFPIKKSVKTEFNVRGVLSGFEGRLSSEQLNISGWADFYKKDMLAKAQLTGMNGQVGLAVDLASTRNDMIVKGKMSLDFQSKAVSSDGKEKTFEDFFVQTLQSSGVNVNLKFQFKTKMDNFSMGQISISGEINKNSTK